MSGCRFGGFDFVQPPLVTAALKMPVQKRLHNSLGLFGWGYLLAQAQNIGVIVLAREEGGFRINRKGRANTWNLVGGNAHADARAADEQAQGAPTPDNIIGDSFGVIRVIG